MLYIPVFVSAALLNTFIELLFGVYVDGAKAGSSGPKEFVPTPCQTKYISK